MTIKSKSFNRNANSERGEVRWNIYIYIRENLKDEKNVLESRLWKKKTEDKVKVESN